MENKNYKISFSVDGSSTKAELEVITGKAKVNEEEVRGFLLQALGRLESLENLTKVRIDLKKKKFSVNAGKLQNLEGAEPAQIKDLKIARFNPFHRSESKLVNRVLNSDKNPSSTFTSFLQN